MEAVAEPLATSASPKEGRGLHAEGKGCVTGWSASSVKMEGGTKPGTLEKVAGVPLNEFQSTCGFSNTRNVGTLRSRKHLLYYGCIPETSMEEK